MSIEIVLGVFCVLILSIYMGVTLSAAVKILTEGDKDES